MAISFLTGQRLTADLLNTNVTAFMPVTYTKTAVTSRNTTTTLANDPDLANIPLGVGTWEVDMLIFWTQASTTPSLKTRWAFTGTWSGTVTRGNTGPALGNTAVASVATIINVGGPTLDTQDAVYGKDAGAGYGAVREICRNVTVTVAGNLSLQWAQNTSNASNVNIQPNSTVTIRRIS